MLALVPFVTRKLEVLLQHSRFFKQIIQYSDITPGTNKQSILQTTHNSVDCRIQWRYAYTGAVFKSCGVPIFYCFANHFERHIELSRSTQAPEENVESYSARLVSLSKQAFPTAGEEVQTQMAKDQLIRGVSND
ncbi:hypothetical protein T03_4198 [Trichinella britovi]|uniref:Uncharacterized protein n=1 Tax=Trichinella britovi TaxID=45882 RepID=A0A0V1C0Z1_TRIBR|nr:hypothetical protein T03_4198 [Trichinella britovi]